MNGSSPFFSIIIPVYNGLENHLSDCLNSIWQQPLDEKLYEVICIDDCSTDQTYKWLQEETIRHHNLFVIRNPKNVRQGGCRNKGVGLAKGEFVMFIDQDDYYHPEALHKVYQHLQTVDVEVLVNDSAYQFRGKESNRKQLNYPSTQIMRWENFAKTNYIAISPWRLTIRRDYYLLHNIKFEENCRIEDIDWGVRLMYYANKVQYFPYILVHYNKAETGTTDNMYKSYGILLDNTKAGNRVYDVALSLYKDSSIQNMIIGIARNTYLFSIKYMFGLWASISRKKEIVQLIPNIEGNYPVVRFAKHYSLFFCILTNLTVPFFRMARMIHRKYAAQRFSK